MKRIEKYVLGPNLDNKSVKVWINFLENRQEGKESGRLNLAPRRTKAKRQAFQRGQKK